MYRSAHDGGQFHPAGGVKTVALMGGVWAPRLFSLRHGGRGIGTDPILFGIVRRQFVFYCWFRGTLLGSRCELAGNEPRRQGHLHSVRIGSSKR